MGIVRLNDEIFTTDSTEYEILAEAVLKIKGIEGGVVEIGTRTGGSAKLIIDGLVANEDTDRSMFCIDPYGNLDYFCSNLNVTAHNLQVEIKGDPNSVEDFVPVRLDYTNEMRNTIVPSLYYYGLKRLTNFQFFCLEDAEFFKAFPDGVPTYNEHKIVVDKYAFVFFDGPHTNEDLIREIEFFGPRSPIGTVWVFDDVWMYNHNRIEELAFSFGFEVITKGNVKASYVKVK